MITRRDAVEIREPIFGDPVPFITAESLPIPGEFADETVESSSEPIAQTSQGLVDSSIGCLTSAQMVGNAQEYLNNVVYIGNASINNNGQCTIRQKPTYLQNAGTYGSVPYAWGKWEKPGVFNNAIWNSGKAGNRNTDQPTQFCAYGVDCSGFVSRLWGILAQEKPGTTTLWDKYRKPMGQMSFALSTGDALNNPGWHVMMFSSNGANGIWAYESVKENGIDRAVYDFRTWSFLAAYKPMRSITSCQ